MIKPEELRTCRDCNGTGIVVGSRVEPRCCGNLNEHGSCCNHPLPDEVPEPQQCERCEATGKELTIKE